jgi:superfamily II RNA helicase
VWNGPQRSANERAQDLCSSITLTGDEKAAIAEEMRGFKFDTPVGNELRRFISHGVGVHHAGLLPKYRLLVEKLAGKGLLKCVCGTDTLGVGVNVPIRTVLFTQLCKFDGNKVRLLSTREFQQIAGRAGRRGFDDEGHVWCQAPAHVVENKRAEAKAAAAAEKSGKKAKKIKKSQPPEKGFVQWNADTFKRMETSSPETLDSSFEVTHGMLLAVLSRYGDGKKSLYDLLVRNHEPLIRRRRHQKRAITMYRSLRDAGIIQEAGTMDVGGRSVTLGFDLQDQFSLTQPLSLFAVQFLPTLLRKYGESRSRLRDEAYALDVLSVLEAVLDTPQAVTYAQVNRMKRRAIASMKNDGVEYDDRMKTIETMDYPRPLEDELEAAYEPFQKNHPYVGNESLKCKSIAREMYDLGLSFNEYVVHHGLNRSEGAVLRYLTDAYKSLVQNVPENLKSQGVNDLEEWLGESIRQVDSSLIDEWEALKDPPPRRRRRSRNPPGGSYSRARSASWCGTARSDGRSSCPTARRKTSRSSRSISLRRAETSRGPRRSFGVRSSRTGDRTRLSTSRTTRARRSTSTFATRTTTETRSRTASGA